MSDVKIAASWKHKLKDEFSKVYFHQIVTFLKTEKSLNKTIYPPGQLIFSAFDHTSFDDLKAVILGQDPYHGAGQAHGLSFSVPAGKALPPSLRNVYKEIKADVGIDMPANYGNLTAWADQGVLMLNSILTVRAGEPSSHASIGWQNFTDAVIQKISDEKSGVVFLLWGKFAHSKQALIDETKASCAQGRTPLPIRC